MKSQSKLEILYQKILNMAYRSSFEETIMVNCLTVEAFYTVNQL